MSSSSVRVGDGVFAAERGPFSLYERRIESLDDGDGDGGMVSETTQFRLAIPFWWFVFVGPYRAALRRPPSRRSTRPWWAPPDPLDARAATVLGLLCLLALVDGYVGTLLTQTVTYVARGIRHVTRRPGHGARDGAGRRARRARRGRDRRPARAPPPDGGVRGGRVRVRFARRSGTEPRRAHGDSTRCRRRGGRARRVDRHRLGRGGPTRLTGVRIQLDHDGRRARRGHVRVGAAAGGHR